MSFYSRGSGRANRGRGNRPRGIWKHGRNKKIRFFVHFNANYEEFNQISTIGHLLLSSPNASYHPSISQGPPQSPLQSHPNIHEIPVQNAINDGCYQAPSNHPI